MRCLYRIALVMGLGLGLVVANADAHRLDETLQATLLAVHVDRIDGAMRVVPGAMLADALIADIDRDGDGTLSDNERLGYVRRVLADLSFTIDGQPLQPRLVASSFPTLERMHEGLGEIAIDYVLDLPHGGAARVFRFDHGPAATRSVHLVNVLKPDDPRIVIGSQTRDATQSSFELAYRQDDAINRAPSIDADAAWSVPNVAGLFRLGMRHIAEGTDHLFFLLALLLVAPPVAVGERWTGRTDARRALLRAAGIVTAFSIAHSITLALATLGDMRLAARAIESLVALSILIAALHAWRPIFPGREARVAALFGLVHGFAFATALDRLDADPWRRAVELAAFNLGVEAMQLLIVVALLPSMLAIAGTRVGRPLRIVASLVICVAACCWIAERLFGIGTPVDAVVGRPADHGIGMTVVVSLAGLTALWSARAQRSNRSASSC